MSDQGALRKVRLIVGNRLMFGNAGPADAEFILGLRTETTKGRFLSATSRDLGLQVAWLKRCSVDDSQVCFITLDKDGEKFGTVRLYDVRGNSFCWGSWLLKDGAPSGYALESALIVYRFAHLQGMSESHFEVHWENESVSRFHERFGAIRMREGEGVFHYKIANLDIRRSLEKYRRYLPFGIRVVE